MDLIANRSLLEALIEREIIPEGLKAGVNIKEIRFGDPGIPPEYLLGTQRKQLAQQLREAYVQEQLAQAERIKSEQAKATANQQPKLVEAEIEVKRQAQLADAKRNEGLGEKAKLDLIAQGQRAQAQVLGEDRVVDLRKFELLLDRIMTFFDKHPDVLTEGIKNAQKFVPESVVTVGEDGGDSLIGPAAVFGKMLNPTPAKPEKKP
jgi:hypothetical protein